MTPQFAETPGFVWRPRDRKTIVLTILLVFPAVIYFIGELYVNRKMSAATYRTTGYAFWYVLPALSSAITILGVWRIRGRGHLTMTELVVILLVQFMLVYAGLKQIALPLGSLPITALLALVLPAGTRVRSESAHVNV